MRYRRFSSFAGWTAVVLLAMVGFAAFSGGDTDTPQAADGAHSSLGHTAGAYAGLSFVMMGESADQQVVVAEPEPTSEAATEDSNPESTASSTPGTGVSPNAGWLSQVEVREIVARYFEAADVNRAVRIAWCESKFDPEHRDLRTGGEGLFNHLPQYWEGRSSNAGFAGHPATDADASAAAAAWEVYNGAGWDVFNCR